MKVVGRIYPSGEKRLQLYNTEVTDIAEGRRIRERNMSSMVYHERYLTERQIDMLAESYAANFILNCLFSAGDHSYSAGKLEVIAREAVREDVKRERLRYRKGIESIDIFEQFYLTITKMGSRDIGFLSIKKPEDKRKRKLKKLMGVELSDRFKSDTPHRDYLRRVVAEVMSEHLREAGRLF